MKLVLVFHAASDSFAVLDDAAPIAPDVEVLFDGDEAALKLLWKALNEQFLKPPEVSVEELQAAADGDLLQAFIALRDRKDANTQVNEKKAAAFEKGLDAISAILIARQQERKIDQISVKGVGTAFRSVRLKVSCGDWTKFHGWLVDQIVERVNANQSTDDLFAFFQRRLTVDTVKQYMKDHEGSVPPAVNALQEYTLNVRRS